MRSSKVTGSKILGLGLIAGIISVAAFAEPAVQPGETLESLSQAKITTTVNGQPGSLQELAASGKIKIWWCFKKYAEKNRLAFDKIVRCK